LSQFNAELCGDHVHSSLGDRISQQGRKTSDTSELDVATLTGNKYDLPLFAVTNEIDEGVDDVDITEQVVFDLRLVKFCCYHSCVRRSIRSH
jgi:hypothetical protein